MNRALICLALLGTMPAGLATAQESAMEVVAAEKRVEEALKSSPDVAEKGVTVARHASSIVLSGEVDTQAEKAAAGKLADSAAEGVRVINRLEVSEDAASAEEAGPSAPEITRHIEQALQADPLTTNLDVTVSMDENDVIGLHGLVPSQQNRRDAEQVASRAAGNFRVRNRLQVPSAQ